MEISHASRYIYINIYLNVVLNSDILLVVSLFVAHPVTFLFTMFDCRIIIYSCYCTMFMHHYLSIEQVRCRPCLVCVCDGLIHCQYVNK